MTLDFQKPATTHTGLDTLLDPRAFCRLRFSPSLATGVLVSLLREHFGNPSSITEPLLQQCVWRSGEGSGILIESSSNEVLRSIDQRPAILVRRNQVQALPPQSINDEIIQTGGQKGRSFGIWLQGSHTIFSIATKAGGAEALANETAILFMQYAPHIKHTLCFEQFRLQEIGQLSVLEGSGGQYVVPSTFSYIARFEWGLDEDLPPLRHVELKVLYQI